MILQDETLRQSVRLTGWVADVGAFLSESDVVHVYKYVKGRSLELVPSGRPASEQD